MAMDWPGEKVLTRVIDTLENSIGGFLRPWQTRRVGRANADARAYERLILEQADIDIADLKAGKKRLSNDGRLIAAPEPETILLERDGPSTASEDTKSLLETGQLSQAARNTSTAREMQRLINLKRVSLYAEEAAERIDERAEEAARPEEKEKLNDIDDDWISKWRSGAEEVSKEEMQQLWGQLLAEEIANPGAYSLHSLDFLKRMSRSDAELLERASPFVTAGGIVKVKDDYLNENGISFSDLLQLNELGLVNGTVGVGGIQYKLNASDVGGRAISTMTAGKKGLVFDLGDYDSSNKNLVFDVYTVTRTGRELLTLTSTEPNKDYLKKIAKIAIDQGAEIVHLGNLLDSGFIAVFEEGFEKSTPSKE